MTITQQLVALAAEVLHRPADAISPDLPWDEQDADSLDIVEILVAIEDRFGVYIPDSAVIEMRTLTDLCDFLERK